MAVEITGSQFISEISDAEDGSISDITVPADADIAIVITGGYVEGDNLCHLDECNWDDGSDMEFSAEIAYADAEWTYSVSSRYMLSSSGDWPGSGSGKTLYFSFDGTVSATTGAFVYLIFAKNIDTGDPIGSTDTDAGDGAAHDNWQTDDLGTGANDMVFIAGANYDSVVDVDPGGTGQTALVEDTLGVMNYGVGYEVGESQPQFTCDVEYWGAIAFVINGAAAGISMPIVMLQMDHFNGGTING